MPPLQARDPGQPAPPRFPACLAWRRAEYLSRLAARLTACNVIASAGNAHHFDEKLFSVKPHAGQQRVAAWLRADLASDRPARNEIGRASCRERV